MAGDPLVALDATQVAGALARLGIRAQAPQRRIARLTCAVPVAQVDILSGKRSVLDYLIAPVVRVKETAFRE